MRLHCEPRIRWTIALLLASAVVCFSKTTTVPPSDAEHIFAAVKCADVASVKAYLKRGGNVNQKSIVETSLLQEAAAAGQLDIVSILWAHGASLEYRTPFGWTALHYAAYSNRGGVIAFLLQKGSKPDVQDILGRLPLHYAAQGEDSHGFEALVGKGYVNRRDKNGQTPLALAAEACCESTGRALVLHGADANSRDKAGYSPLYGLCATGGAAWLA